MVVAEMYYKLDSFLVGGANVAVKIWNGATGGTRADLADVLNVSSSIPILKEIPFLFPLVGLRIIGGHYKNHQIDYEDEKARDTKDFQVEKYREELEKTSRVCGGIGAFKIAFPNTPDFNSSLVGFGFIGLALSNYIMRADYQKPRKDCVRRGLGKLSEIIQDWRATPEPVPIGANYSERFEAYSPTIPDTQLKTTPCL